jgi:putative ABC transport system permease protein
VNVTRFAARTLRREWRSGDLRIVAAALVVAVASLVSVASFGDRLQQALVRQGSELLAADLVVRSPEQQRQGWIQAAHDRGLHTALTVEFRSVVLAGEGSQLAEVKAVSGGYPLRGELRTAPAADAVDTPTQGIPAQGRVWVDGRLLALLELAPGARVQLGTARFDIARVITLEPDRGGVAFSLAPRVLMNVTDLPATGLVQPGSIVRYRLLVAGTAAAVADYRLWLVSNGVADSDIQDVGNAQPRFRTALDRGERFLGLATLVSLLLAGVAIARAARHYAQRHLDTVAVMRCLGAVQREIVALYLLQLCMLASVASLAGAALGYLGQQVFVWLLPGLVAGDLPWPSLRPALAGWLVGVVAMLGFAAPMVVGLKDVPPLRVIRRELGRISVRALTVYLAALATLALLILWMARDVGLTLWVFGGVLVLALGLTVVAWGLVFVLSRVGGGVGVAWRFGILNLARRGQSTTSQIVALGVGVMAMLLLTLVRGDLLREWQTALPADTPNHFLINVQPHQLDAVGDFFVDRGLAPPQLTPIVRARLTAINGRAVDPASFQDPFARRSVQRAANLSWAAQLRDDNKLVAGKWWSEAQASAALVSVEQRYAEALGLRLGDRLRYRAADREVEVTVASFRTVSWDTFRPNFFLLVPPKLLEGYPVSYITSLHLPRDEMATLQKLVRAFPNITDIDVDAVLQQVRKLVERVNMALQYIFLFTIAAGLVVLYAAVHTSRDERRQEIALLRTLGAQGPRLAAGLMAEFATLGALAGLVGAVAASGLGWALATLVLDVPYHFNAWVWIAGILSASVVVVGAGILSARSDLRTPPWQILRET